MSRISKTLEQWDSKAATLIALRSRRNSGKTPKINGSKKLQDNVVHFCIA